MARRRYRRSISGFNRLGVVLVGVVVLKLANSTAVPLLAGIAVLVVLLVLFAALNGDGAGKTSRNRHWRTLIVSAAMPLNRRWPVVTNSTFSPAAVHLAQLHGCTLIDRTGLAAWLRQAG